MKEYGPMEVFCAFILGALTVGLFQEVFIPMARDLRRQMRSAPRRRKR